MQAALWIDTPALGDTIAAIPVIRKISEAHGNKPIVVFTTKPFLFENHPLVEKAFKSDADKSEYKIYRAFSPIVGKTYNLNGENVEFRYSNMDLRQFHAVSLGFTLTEAEMDMDLYIETERELSVKDYVIIHPTYTWPTRTWEQEKWQELIDRLNDQGIPVVAVGRDAKEVGFFNTDKPVMPINIKYGVNLLNDPDNDPAELRWMMNHRARAVVTMDSGILHVAGTTDVNIIQLGSSIDNKLRAPYRKGSQNYKYQFVRGGCGEFCSSSMKYNIQVHGHIHGIPPQVKCLADKPTFECHPSVDQVFDSVMGLYNVKGRVKLVHLLLEDDIDPNRQNKSIESLSQLESRGVEYIQIWNKRWTEEPPRENFTRPDMFDKIPIKPAHYGAFRAFADATIEHFTPDVDAFIICEGDALLTEDVLTVADRINDAIQACETHDIKYFSLGSRYALEDGTLQSITIEQHGDIHLVDRLIGIQTIMFPKKIRQYLVDKFKYATWDGADIFLNDIFVNKFNLGIFDKSISTQASGISAIEGVHRTLDQSMRILFLAPHLSTGGMPEFLLTRLKALQDDPALDVHVVEYCLYATSYTVQRDQIKALLPQGNFHEIGHLGTMEQEEREAKLKAILESVSPDIIHIEECPESFDSFNQMSESTQAWIYSNQQPWKLVETCHNIWFDPRSAKRYSPDAYALCSPHHRLETFSEEPSEKQEVHFPIISHNRSETQREKSLEIFGLENLSNSYHIVNIGLWTPGKNQAEALDWATHLEAQYPGKYQFHFVGNQASNFEHYWAPLMQALPANVHIHGERSDIHNFYGFADAIAFNSTWECNPLALRQSIGWPIPVMARNLPQYHGMYQKYVTGIVGNTAEDCSNLQRALETKVERNIQDSMARFKKDHINLYKKALNIEQPRYQHSNAEWSIKWDNGPRVTSHTGRDLFCDFLVDGKSVYNHTLQGDGHWCKPSIEWYRDWTVVVDGIEHKLDLKDRVATVRFNSSSLGDTLSWVEAVREFRFAKGLKKVYLATHKNWLFDQDWYRTQGIEFIAPGEEREDSVADWAVGVYMQDPPGTAWFPHRNKRDWRKIYLGDIATDQLGLPSIQKAPRLIYKGKHQQDRPYICIATQSTAQAKYWNNPTGWQELVDHYNKKGYDVYHMSKEGTDIKGVIQAPEDMAETFALINGAELFVGISSGLSWLAWCTETPVVMISGFTPEECEYQNERTLRIIDKEVCNGCWAWDHFNRGDWNWCPTGKGNDRHFECTKVLTGERVINMINEWQLAKETVEA